MVAPKLMPPIPAPYKTPKTFLVRPKEPLKMPKAAVGQRTGGGESSTT